MEEGGGEVGAGSAGVGVGGYAWGARRGAGARRVGRNGGVTVGLGDKAAARAEKARADIDKRLAKAVEKGKLDAETHRAIVSRIEAVEGLEGLASADFVVEAVNENEALKRQVRVSGC